MAKETVRIMVSTTEPIILLAVSWVASVIPSLKCSGTKENKVLFSKADAMELVR